MWSLKHYSHLILILLTIDFTAPYKLFFCSTKQQEVKKPFPAYNYFAFTSLKIERPYYKEQLPFYIS